MTCSFEKKPLPVFSEQPRAGKGGTYAYPPSERNIAPVFQLP